MEVKELLNNYNELVPWEKREFLDNLEDEEVFNIFLSDFMENIKYDIIQDFLEKV